MHITVFCGSGFGNNPAFKEAAEEVGAFIADHGFGLVYGGSDCGLMGVVANAALSHHGTVIGVEPEFFLEQGLDHKGITQTIPCKTMSERKSIMMEMSDAYIALPGGAGTLDEFSEVVTLSALGREDKLCVLYNCEGYYDGLLAFYNHMVECGFLSAENMAKIKVVKNIKELEQLFGFVSCGR